MTRPIAAFSMEDYERLTRSSYQAAEFARGKDKKKRKSRAGMIAGGIGAGLATAGAIGAGVRYGGAELATRGARKKASGLSENLGKSQSALKKSRKQYDTGRKFGGTAYADQKYGNAVKDATMGYEDAYAAGKKNANVMTSGGAGGALKRDVNRLRNSFGGKTGNAMDAIGYGAKNTGRAIQGGYRTNALGKTGIGRYASGAVGAGRAALGTTGGKIGAGLAGAALLGGAAYGVSRMNKNKKKK